MAVVGRTYSYAKWGSSPSSLFLLVSWHNWGLVIWRCAKLVGARVMKEVGFSYYPIRMLGLTASPLCCGSSRRYQAGTCISGLEWVRC